LVSAGFDAYREDPLMNLLLETDDFLSLSDIGLVRLGVPAMAILEGGYKQSIAGTGQEKLPFAGWSGPAAPNSESLAI